MTVEVETLDSLNWDVYLNPNEAENIVTTRFESTKDYADDQLSTLTNFVDDVADYLKDITMPDADVDYDHIKGTITDALTVLQSYRPDKPSNLSIEDVDAPSKPILEDINEMDVSDIPAFDVTPYSPSYDDPPNTDLPTDPGNAPSLTYPEKIAEPDYEIPNAPTLEDITIPADPEIPSVPTFEGKLPTLTLDPPENTFTYSEGAVNVELQDAIKEVLLDDIEEGGTGLGADVEDDIWDRMQERRRTTYESDYSEIMESQNAGFDMPPGALVARLDELQNAHNRELSEDSRVIAIEQAKLALDNKHWTIEKATALQQVINEHFNAVANRTLEAAVQTMRSLIDIFQARVAAYNAQIANYQAQAEAYQRLLDGTRLIIEQWKARLEGKRLVAEIQNQKIALYTARIDAIKTIVATYAERVRSQGVELEAERLKLQAFESQVNVYTQKLNAKTAAYNLWVAQVNAEGQKIDNYAKQVDAYNSRINAIQTEANIQATEINAQIETNKNLLEQYRSNIQKYQSDLEFAVQKVKTKLEEYGHDVDIYEADASVLDAQQKNEIALLEALIEQANNNTQLQIQEAQLELESAVQTYQINLEAIKAQAQVAAQVAASALSAVHASAAIGHQYSATNSKQLNRSQAIQNAAQLTDYHYYDETGV